MAMPTFRVFGKPITDGTRAERALAAKNNPNADGKHDQANLVLKPVGQPTTISKTRGKIYNATGDTITYVLAHDWEGHVASYPQTIENGQWAIIEHYGTRSPRTGSVAAIVYSVANRFDTVISWNNPWKKSGEQNTAYCEMNDPGYFDDSVWDTIKANLMKSTTYCKAIKDDYATEVTIDVGSNAPTYTADFYLDA